jgi:hypothetical protein
MGTVPATAVREAPLCKRIFEDATLARRTRIVMRPGMGVTACIEADLPHLFAEEFMLIDRVQDTSFPLN